MQLDAERAAFVASPVMIVIGTCDAELRPEIGRGLGARIAADGIVEIVLSGWQWPATLDNLRRTGQAAATFARPSDYVAYQVKGSAALRPADAADLAHAERYMAAIDAELQGLGLPQAVIAPWLVCRDPAVLRLTPARVFVQTPGAQAGRPLDATR
ncbi:hypothetical protein ACFOGJ_00550 [Marinibaculum pumilum]|uniref:Pyridoxamine 5'-phosphate oxidase putative domain-containing protein n=1 Tax=Marinibaculum pumilum TaxID=1766165 RepID=A0ABV7KTM8_9PROT